MKVAVVVLALLALASAAPKDASKLFKHPVMDLHSKPNPRLFGGEEAKPHSHPYQVALLFFTEVTAGLCSGSLISQNYILTAAHCLDGANYVEVVLGAHDLSDLEATRVILSSNYFKIHEDYNIGTIDTISNDIALVKLPEPVGLNDVIQTIGIPSDASEDFAGSLAVVSGWGITYINAPFFSNSLNEAEVGVISNQACQDIYGPVITSSTLCTYDSVNGVGIGVGVCTGDSGGPLVADGQLIGLVSFTSPICGQYPSGFTRITSYIDWIKANTDL